MMTPTRVVPGVGYSVNQAAVDQTAAVFALLPELLSASALPSRFFIAHVTGDTSRLLGAAAFVPQVQNSISPGFSGQCRVLPAFQRLGIGRALVQRLADDARGWDVTQLLSWSQHEESDAATAFLRATGFRPGMAMHHFTLDTALMRASALRMYQSLNARGRIPANAMAVPLAQVPTERAAALLSCVFGDPLAHTRAKVERTLAHPMGRALSFGLWDGATLTGLMLAGASESDGIPEVFFLVSDPAQRSGWQPALLHEHFTRAMEEGGHAHARYRCNDRTPSSLNLVRRANAKPGTIYVSQVLDL